MGVYVDALRRHQRRNAEGWEWCHLAADTVAELHAFAASIGVRRCWYHRGHYDLKPTQRAAAVAAGAVETTGRGLVAVLRRCRGRA